MESSGKARTFFERWFAAINGDDLLPRVHDKKLSILALCSLLELAPAAVPQSLQSGWPGILGGILTIFKDLPKAIAGQYFSEVARSLLRPFLARKVLEESLEASDDDELVEEKILNLNEEEGKDKRQL